MSQPAARPNPMAQKKTTKPKAKSKGPTKAALAAIDREKKIKRVCERIASSADSVAVICAPGIKDTPPRSTFLSWLHQEGGSGPVTDAYRAAKMAQADFMAEEIIEIADDTSGDTVTKTRPDGSTYEELDREFVARSKVRIDARKWAAGNLRPDFYGDRTAIDLTTTTDTEHMTDAELEAHTRRLADRLGVILPERLLEPE